jgi:hypothetical protein
MVPTIEERQAIEIEGLRKARDEYRAEKHELRDRLMEVSRILSTPTSEEQPDVEAFGRDVWVYCNQHMKVHLTGWCSVSPRDKIGLGVKTVQEGIEKCREWKLPLHQDRD